MYGISVSRVTLSAMTDKIIGEVRQWQQRSLESHYHFVWLDAIHYIVKDNGRHVSKAIFPGTEVQLCIVHQIRNSMKCVGLKNSAEVYG